MAGNCPRSQSYTGQTLLTVESPYDAASLGDIGAGQSRDRDLSVVLPAGLSGRIEFTVTTDADGQLFENNLTGTAESNNATTAVVLSALRSRRRQSVSSTTTPVTGDLITLQWDDVNNGNSPMDCGWFDRIRIVNQTTNTVLLNEHVRFDPPAGAAVAPGASVARSYSFRLTDGAAACRRSANPGQRGSEHHPASGAVGEVNAGGTGETNNSATVNLVSTLAEYPDLTVSDVAINPESGWQPGDAVTVSWKTHNEGNQATARSWSETLRVRNLTNGQTLFTLAVPYDASASGAIAAGASRHRDTTLLWPEGAGAIGQFEFTVTTDSGAQVFEHNPSGSGESNNAAQRTRVSAPDLRVINLSTQLPTTQAGGTVNLSWNDLNAGNAASIAGWADRIVVRNLTTGETLLEALQAFDPEPGVGGPGVGQSLPRSFTFALPSGARGAGQIEIQVTTDAGAVVAEVDASGASAEGNNSSTLTLTSASVTYPDLRASTLQAPGAARGGNSVPLQWTVTNAGPVGTTQYWSDRIVLSDDALIGDADDIVLATVAHSGGLTAGASYTTSHNVTMPNRIAGTWFLAVIADALSEVTEPDTRADNTLAPLVPIALSAPFADLQIDVAVAPAEIIEGTSANVLWRVVNRGDSTTDASQWKDALYLSTDATIDDADLFLGQFQHDGSLTVGASYTTTATVVAPNGIPGTYRFLMRIDSVGQVFEGAFEGNNTGSTLSPTQIRITPAPDLAVQSVQGPTEAVSGAQVGVTWTVSNEGEAQARAPWTDRIYLSADGTLNGATEIGSLMRTEHLEAGASYTRSMNVTLPERPDGSFRLLVVSDSAGQVFEQSREANNRLAASGSIQITHTDLVVTSVAIPASATGGDSVAIEWRVENAGSHDAQGTWLDRVYLTPNGQIDSNARELGSVAHTGPLTPGAGYDAVLAVTLPVDLSGTYQIVVVTDAMNAVREFGAEGNNRGAAALDVALAPYADLRVTEASGPSGEIVADPARITVTWTVTNEGTGTGFTSEWTDAIVASQDSIAGNGDDIVLGQFRHVGALAPGGESTRSETFFLPPGFTGRYTLFVRADAATEVFENGSESNNAFVVASPLDIMPIPYADLALSGVTAAVTAESGGPLSVSWQVTNEGIGRTNVSQWSDRVLVTRDPAGTQLVVGEIFDHLGVLGAGESYERDIDITLPDGITGTVYVTVTTLGPFEFIYTDNNRDVAGPVTVTLAPSADLRVSDIVAPASAAEGDEIEITWTVINDGTVAAIDRWTDSVILRRAGGAALPVILGAYAYDRGLDPGRSYTRTERLRLPARIEGAWQVEVTTDVTNQIYEHGAAANNNTLLDDAALALHLKARPDLQVGTITAPPTVSSGGTVQVSFTVFNRGSVATTTPRWQDNVYLSLDNKVGGDDILIGSIQNGSALEPGLGYSSQTASAIVPLRFRGDGFIIVQADASASVDEYPDPFEANNTISIPIHVEPVPLADLVTGEVVAPAQGIYGQEIEVRYRVTNKGSSPTDRAAWTDTIWLARDKTRPNPGGNGGILLGSVTHEGRLERAGSYEVATRVRIPNQIESGLFYITPWADAYDLVFEDTLASNLNPDDPNEFDNNNYKARAIDIIGTPIPPLPDLVVASITTSGPASADVPFTVTWAVENIGEGDAADWIDTVWLSDQPDLNTPNAKIWTLGSFQRVRSLASMASYSTTQTFDLSPAATGQYVIIKTDTAFIPSVKETDENNNARTFGASVTTPPADLRVTAITSQLQNFSGEKTRVSWTVVNDGGAVWGGTRLWSDTVFISPDPTFIPGRATLLGTFVHALGDGLDHGEAYTQDVEVTLPAGIGGEFFLYVFADTSSDEHLGGGPNFFSRSYYGSHVWEQVNGANSGRGEISVVYREPDLQVTAIVVPDGEIRSGDTLSVAVTISNLGTRATRQLAWLDRLYLSADPSLDPTDLKLGEFLHLAPLNAGASYTLNANARMPEGASGPFYLIAYADSDVEGSTARGHTGSHGSVRRAPATGRSAGVPRRGQQHRCSPDRHRPASGGGSAGQPGDRS